MSEKIRQLRARKLGRRDAQPGKQKLIFLRRAGDADDGVAVFPNDFRGLPVGELFCGGLLQDFHLVHAHSADELPHGLLDGDGLGLHQHRSAVGSPTGAHHTAWITRPRRVKQFSTRIIAPGILKK